MNEEQRGSAYAAAAYVLWGCFPLYFPLLKPAGAFEILSHRVVVVAGVRAAARAAGPAQVGMGGAAVHDRRRLGLLASRPP